MGRHDFAVASAGQHSPACFDHAPATRRTPSSCGCARLSLSLPRSHWPTLPVAARLARTRPVSGCHGASKLPMLLTTARATGRVGSCACWACRMPNRRRDRRKAAIKSAPCVPLRVRHLAVSWIADGAESLGRPRISSPAFLAATAPLDAGALQMLDLRVINRFRFLIASRTEG